MECAHGFLPAVRFLPPKSGEVFTAKTSFLQGDFCLYSKARELPYDELIKHSIFFIALATIIFL